MAVFFFKYMLTQSDHISFKLKKDCLVKVNNNGIIESIVEQSKNTENAITINQLVIPGLTNAHSHAFQFQMRGFADNPKNFKDWVNTYLYPTVEQFDENSLRKIYHLFFKSLLSNGITSLGEFHYFHHYKPYDNRFDSIFLEEAKESGIRLSLLYSAYDKGSREAQKKFHHTKKSFLEALNITEKHFESYGKSDQWSLSVAPHSLHGCSDQLLKYSVEWATERDLKWHIHLSEQKHDLVFSKEIYNKTPLFALESILKNKLDHNACLVHAVWLTGEELNLFNERKINLIYNPFTNMYLGDGISQTSRMNFNRSLVALGTDSNNAFNMFTEVKLFESLQRVKHLEMGIIDPNILLSSITSFGGHLLNLNVGKLKAGFFADFIELDFDENNIPIDLNKCNVDEILNHLIFSGVDSKAIKSIFIGGEKRPID